MAQANTIRLSESSHKMLRQLAEAAGEPMHAVLAKAIEEYRRKHFFEQLNASFAALKRDPTASREQLAEHEAFAGASADGLDAGEVWTDDEKLKVDA